MTFNRDCIVENICRWSYKDALLCPMCRTPMQTLVLGREGDEGHGFVSEKKEASLVTEPVDVEPVTPSSTPPDCHVVDVAAETTLVSSIVVPEEHNDERLAGRNFNASSGSESDHPSPQDLQIRPVKRLQ
mmetsp:Transcript_34848/g.54476  ORF Transcript_34848/g.54476 Transcript_34848/m.54476 type:complete len:130 (-) Transcript_34848:957-1346(-)